MVSDIFLYIPIYITNVNVFEEINMGGFKKYIKYMALMFILMNSFPEKILDFCPPLHIVDQPSIYRRRLEPERARTNNINYFTRNF